MKYSTEELSEAKKQIDSVLHKTRQALISLEAKENPQRRKAQITLAKRRIRAFEISSDLLRREIGGDTAGPEKM